jgi:anaerobic magnesium-protoporphyrin IX monomethyl ester cyclase
MDNKPVLNALLVYISSVRNAWQLPRQSQLGLYYIAQYAVDAGYHVRVENLSANDYVARRLIRLLQEHSCDLLGLYVDQDNLWDIRRILPAIKDRLGPLNIILGGPQVTADPEQTLMHLPQATCGVIGEGEETFLELLGLSDFITESLVGCRGLAIRTENGTKLTPSREPIDQLDRITNPKFRELNLDTEASIPLSMITGRGCHGRCAFCYEGRPIEGRKRLRLHSTERCLEQFGYLAKQLSKKQYICIVDDSFVADHRRLRDFCTEIKKKWNGRIKWFCEARVDTLYKHPDLIPLMIDAGLIRLQVGGESGSQRILDIYRKGTTIEQMYSVVLAAKNSGLLSLYANFIIGGAFETYDTYQETLDFALELLRLSPGCMGVGKSFFTPYPGTPMNDNPTAFGLQLLDKEAVSGQGDDHVFCRTEQLSRMEILAIGHDFEEKVKQTVSTLCKDLPFDVIRRHFQANHDYGLTTEWYEELCRNRAMFNYFESITKAGAKTFAEASLQDFEDMYPIRCIELVASKGMNYVTRTFRGSVRELDAIESIIIDLSAGKLSFADIVEVINLYLPDLNPDKVREALVKRYSQFDKEFQIIWKTNVI